MPAHDSTHSALNFSAVPPSEGREAPTTPATRPARHVADPASPLERSTARRLAHTSPMVHQAPCAPPSLDESRDSPARLRLPGRRRCGPRLGAFSGSALRLGSQCVRVRRYTRLLHSLPERVVADHSLAIAPAHPHARLHSRHTECGVGHLEVVHNDSILRVGKRIQPSRPTTARQRRLHREVGSLADVPALYGPHGVEFPSHTYKLPAMLCRWQMNSVLNAVFEGRPKFVPCRHSASSIAHSRVTTSREIWFADSRSHW